MKITKIFLIILITSYVPLNYSMLKTTKFFLKNKNLQNKINHLKTFCEFKPNKENTEIISSITSSLDRWNIIDGSSNLLLLALEFNKKSSSLNQEKELLKLRKKLSELIKATKNNDLDKIKESQHDFNRAALTYIYNFDGIAAQKPGKLDTFNMKPIQLENYIALLDRTLDTTKDVFEFVKQKEELKSLNDKIDKK